MLRRLTDSAHESGSALAGLIALALALLGLVTALAEVVVSVIGQHVGGAGAFHVGHTRIDWPGPLKATIVVVLVGLGLYGAARAVSPELQTCPDCLSAIPSAATVCRYCTSQLEEAGE